MRVNFEYDMHLQYENRALKARIRELESGAAYVRMQEECEKRCREMEREVRKLKTELENAVRQLRQNREHWFQVYGDMEKEHKKVVERKQGEIRRLQKLCEKTAIAYEQMHEKYLGQLHLRYAAESALEEEKGKNQKLRAQLNRDHENSSIPSSKLLRPKKVANSREKTGRKPGAQPGHKGHCRKKQEPTVPTVFLPPPEAVLEDPDFKKTAKTIIKQLVSIRMVLDVTEYHADVYYNAKSKVAADAELYVAEKKAEANRALNDSLNSNLLEYYKITDVESRWNGELPAYVGDGNSIPIINGIN